MELTPALAKAYLAADYRVFTAEGTLLLKAGEPCAALAQIHMQFGVTCSALLTAYNPFSVPTDNAQNRARQQELTERLTPHWTLLDAESADPSGVWPAEPSLLVLGINAEQALAIGRDFGQFAVLFIDDQGTPRLLACDPDQQSQLEDEFQAH